MDDRVGQQLGNYQLLQLLGQGGFADVYLSEHIHLHTRAAIKVLQLRLVESNVQSFLNEARTIAHLVHPSIIRVLDFGVQDGIPFLVMDYAPKGTFRQRFLKGHGRQLPATSLFPYIKQVATALQYAHNRKLIHRDVKPENMLLGPNDEVLLSDFGFALIQSSTSRSSAEAAGTAAYMAPEQLQGKPRPASDQYALGIIAYEWLTGSCPFHGTFFEIASQHMLTPPPSLREKVPSLSAEIENVVMTALAKDPNQRFPTVQDFAAALERACLAEKTASLADQTRPDEITRSADWSGNAMPLSELASQAQITSPEPNSGRDNLLLPDIQPLSGKPFSQSGQHTLAQQRNALSGIHPLPSNPNPLSASPSQNFSPSSLSWSPEPFSQSGLHTLAQPQNSLSSVYPLSPEQFSQRGQSSILAPNLPSTGPKTMMSNLQSYPSQDNHQMSSQSQWNQMPDFASNRTQLKPASIQLSSQGWHGIEFKDDLQKYRRSGTPTSMIIFVITLAILIIGGGAGLISWSGNHPSMGRNSNGQSQDQIAPTASTSPTATVTAHETSTSLDNKNPYVLGSSTLVMNDPLSSNNQANQWQQNPQDGCQFINGNYHALAMPTILTPCFATGTANYSNFTYEIQMLFITNGPKYTSGGILFRGSSNQNQFYLFEVYASGRYLFQKCNDGSCTILAGSTIDPPLPAYHVNQTNTLAVVANQNTFTFYINQQLVGSQQTDNNNPYTQGMIGVLARGGLQTTIPTEVAYGHIRVWL